MIQLVLIFMFMFSDVGYGAESWALLAAGSSGWVNYRHQSDVFHAYQLLSSSSEYITSRIITIAADDIAFHARNPFRGQVFNHPNLVSDVYAGVRGNVDYSGNQVNATTFLAVLEGVGREKVIASGPKDRVFVFFSDHGAPGILGMPDGPPIFANELYSAIKRKKSRGGFAEMVIYIESCESGSIFQGFDYKKLNVYAVTASNAEESSWATYCPGFGPEPSNETEIDVCLGDLFSVSWLEDLESRLGRNQNDSETLEEQYLLTQIRTSVSNTFSMGSHVMQWGDLEIDTNKVAEFEGSGNQKRSFLTHHNPSSSFAINLNQHAADLVPLRGQELELEVRRRKGVKSKAQALAAHFEALLDLTDSPRDASQQLVDDWLLFQSLIYLWGEICCSPGPLDSFSLSFSRLFADLSNARVTADLLSAAWKEIERRSEAL